MDYPMKHWKTGQTLFIAQIDCVPETPDAIKKRLATKAAVEKGKRINHANLRGAKSNLNVPSVPQLHQRVYQASSKAGALDMRDWHSECGTTHCRAGWIVKIAGEGGGKLEAELGTPLAAYLIAQESGMPVAMREFYVSNQFALESMRKAAELEAEREGAA